MSYLISLSIVTVLLLILYFVQKYPKEETERLIKNEIWNECITSYSLIDGNNKTGDTPDCDCLLITINVPDDIAEDRQKSLEYSKKWIKEYLFNLETNERNRQLDLFIKNNKKSRWFTFASIIIFSAFLILEGFLNIIDNSKEWLCVLSIEYFVYFLNIIPFYIYSYTTKIFKSIFISLGIIGLVLSLLIELNPLL